MFSLIEQGLVWCLELFHDITGSYGWAIVILTVLLRIALAPLNRVQIVSMRKMTKLQPLMKEVQDKYKDEPEKLNKEMQRIWKENKVNPWGCMVMFLQMPILIMLFRVLRDETIFASEKWLGFFNLYLNPIVVESSSSTIQPPVVADPTIGMMFDLHAWIPLGFFAHKFLYLPSMILWAIYIVLTILTSKQYSAPAATAEQAGQQKLTSNMMLYMFMFFGLIFPAGVLLYWSLFSGLGYIQSVQINRWLAAQEAEENDARPGEMTVDAESVEAVDSDAEEGADKPKKKKKRRGRK